MKKINLWESSKKEEFIYFNNTKDYFSYLDLNNLELDFVIKDSYTEFDDIECELDKYAFDNNIEFIYTDKDHPIAYSNNKTFINPAFFKKHINVFKRYAIKKFEKKIISNKPNIIIPSFILTDSLLDILTFFKRKYNFYLKDFGDGFELTEKQKNKIKNNFLEFFVSKRFHPQEHISSKYVINHYTLDDFKSNMDIIIEIPTDDKTINNMVYIGKDNNIILAKSGIQKEDEELYFNIIKKIFNKLKNVNHSFNIEISVHNRELLNRSNLLNNIPSNINLKINNNRFVYDIATYQKEEEKLNNLINPIKNSNLSPFEKYIAIYNIVKKFKPYKDCQCSEDNNACQKSRILKYVLEDDNEYIVCEGYAKLLKELLNKINIPCQELVTFVDLTKDEDYNPEKDKDRSGHDRNLIIINDDKYNIHGYYIADPTFDNITDFDIYLNCLMTFDRKKEARRLEYLTNEDILLDFHNFEEFQRKINFFLKRKINEHNYNTEKENIQFAYIALYKCILKILKQIDYNKYSELYDKYNKYLTDYTIDISSLENIASKMLTEYANYIIPLTNNNISFETILAAAAVVKSKIDNYSDEQIKIWLKETINNNEEVGKYTLPYIYDPADKTEAYITNHPNSKIKNLKR